MFVYFCIPKLPFSYFPVSPPKKGTSPLHLASPQSIQGYGSVPSTIETQRLTKLLPPIILSPSTIESQTQRLPNYFFRSFSTEESRTNPKAAAPLVGEVVCTDKPPTMSSSLYLPSTKTELGAGNTLILYFATYSS